MPHSWTSPLLGKDDPADEVFALQTALVEDGDYPPAGKSMNECPRSGTIGACTKAALSTFQSKYGISGEQGIAGPKTESELNQLFSAKMI